MGGMRFELLPQSWGATLQIPLEKEDGRMTLNRRLTADDIEAAASPRGGFTRRQLAAWGVPWPPPKGWKKRLIRDGSPTPILDSRRASVPGARKASSQNALVDDFCADVVGTLERIGELPHACTRFGASVAETLNGMMEYVLDTGKVTERMDQALWNLMNAVENRFPRISPLDGGKSCARVNAKGVAQKRG